MLEEYDEWLWLDNTVELLVPPSALLADWLADADLALPLHSFRDSVPAEAEGVLDTGRDEVTRVYEQLAGYLRRHPDRLDRNPHWTGLLARRRTSLACEAGGAPRDLGGRATRAPIRKPRPPLGGREP